MKLPILIVSLIILVIAATFMKDYSSLGLNQYLEPSAAISNAQFNDAYTYQASLDRGAIDTRNLKNASITNAKLDTFSFNKGSGGTLVLGGTANGNGIFSLKNAGGTEIIGMDNSGMMINSGKITVKDSNGTTVMDSSGLFSTNVFRSDSVSSGAVNSTTSGTAVDIPNSSLTTPSFTRNTRVLVFFLNSTYLSGQSGGDYAGLINTYLTIDNSHYTTLNHQGYSVSGDASAVDVLTQSGQYIATLGSGTHTIKMQWKITQTSGNNAQANSLGFDIGYVVLGN